MRRGHYFKGINGILSSLTHVTDYFVTLVWIRNAVDQISDVSPIMLHINQNIKRMKLNQIVNQ